ncbi:MAG: thioredoxin family protein [Tissierellia bacterium]|nr:thioredoxin family protein [Tissierellia bacterium]
MAKITKLSSKTIETKLFGDDSPKVVLFYIYGCCPCKAIEPLFLELAADYTNRIDFYKFQTNIDIVNKDKFIKKFDIKPFPCILFIKNGRIMKKIHGEKPERLYRETCKELIK